MIAYLAHISLRQHAYEDAPKTHALKTGTPTMGGLLFAIALAAANPIARYHHIEVWPFARYPFNND